MKHPFNMREKGMSRYALYLKRLLCIVPVLILFYGCRKEDPSKPTVTVHSGSSIQAAVDAAGSNTVIYIEPGVYAEAVTITKPGMELIGITGVKNAGVVIRNPGEEEDGITVTGSAGNFTLKNVTVEGFEENGVLLTGVNGFLLSNVSTVNNGDYGIFPVRSANGVIEFCTANGHSDTGIYVGQSSDVVMRFNTAYANVNGLEVENSSNITVTENNTYNTVTGILVTLLPGLEVKTSSRILISRNLITANNHVNFAHPGELEAFIPSGTGILILGTDLTQVEDNSIVGNNFSGVVVFSSLVLVQLANVSPLLFAGMEPNPDGLKVERNLLLKNGGAPPKIAIPLPGVDLLWDGSGKNNCWSNNIFVSSFPLTLPACK
jgi:parallel beta-helix repeat protein